jgi:hypothetical protein
MNNLFVVCIVMALDMLLLMPYHHSPHGVSMPFQFSMPFRYLSLHGISFFPSFVFLYSFTVLSSAAIVATITHIPVSFDFLQENPVT